MTEIFQLRDILKWNSSLQQQKKLFHLYAGVKVKVMRKSRVCVFVCAVKQTPCETKGLRLSTAVPLT